MRSQKSPTRRIAARTISREQDGVELELLPQPSSTSPSAHTAPSALHSDDFSSSGDEGTAGTAPPDSSLASAAANRSRGHNIDDREITADADPLFDWNDATAVHFPSRAVGGGGVPSWTGTCVLLFISIFTCPLLALAGYAFALAACIAGRFERQPYALMEGVGVGANPEETRWTDRVALAVDPDWAHRSRRRAIRWRVRARSFAIASIVSGAVVLTVVGIIVTFGWIGDVNKTPLFYEHFVSNNFTNS